MKATEEVTSGIVGEFSRADWKRIEEAVHDSWAKGIVYRGRGHAETEMLSRLWLAIRHDILGIDDGIGKGGVR